MFCSDCGAQIKEHARFCGQCGVRQGGLHVGALLDNRYRVDAPIGSGAMGEVFRAWDLRLQAPRAVKELSPAVATEAERDEARIRFTREAQLLSSLQHPGLPRVQDFFSDAGRHYLVMDFVEGDNLEEVVKRQGRPGLPEAQVVAIAVQILDILAFLHGQPSPIIYRDLKPANAILAPAERVVLVDFGIARPLSPASTGSAVGTHGYCPPEQYAGLCDARSDLYALGATMHHLLSGQPSPVPFQFAPLRNTAPHVSPRLERVVQQALAHHREDRFDSARSMKQALEAVVARANPVVPITAGATRSSRAGARARLNPVDGSLLVRLPGGTVVVGAAAQAGVAPPQVTLDPFWIAPRPVTNAQFRRFVTTTGHRPATEWGAPLGRAPASAGAWERYAVLWGEDAPVVGVSRRDAEAYCRWANVRLPLEAEWDLTIRAVQQAGLPQRPPSGPDLTWHVPEWCCPSPLPAPSGPGGSAVRAGVWAAPDAFPQRPLTQPVAGAPPSLRAGFRCAANA